MIALCLLDITGYYVGGSKQETLKEAEEAKDTTKYWKISTAAVEKAFVNTLRLQGSCLSKGTQRARQLVARLGVNYLSGGHKHTLHISGSVLSQFKFVLQLRKLRWSYIKHENVNFS